MYVFVPLSGLASVNGLNATISRASRVQVFVPLSGLASVNVNERVGKKEEKQFSSPYRG